MLRRCRKPRSAPSPPCLPPCPLRACFQIRRPRQVPARAGTTGSKVAACSRWHQRHRRRSHRQRLRGRAQARPQAASHSSPGGTGRSIPRARSTLQDGGSSRPHNQAARAHPTNPVQAPDQPGIDAVGEHVFGPQRGHLAVKPLDVREPAGEHHHVGIEDVDHARERSRQPSLVARHARLATGARGRRDQPRIVPLPP